MNAPRKCLFGSAVLMVVVALAPCNAVQADSFFDVFVESVLRLDDGPMPQTLRQTEPRDDLLLVFFLYADMLGPDEGAADDILIYGAVLDPEEGAADDILIYGAVTDPE